MDGVPLSVGGDGSGASSSKQPPIDLNLPPADEPASPSDHLDQGPLTLSEAEQHILARLGSNLTLSLLTKRERSLN